MHNSETIDRMRLQITSLPHVTHRKLPGDNHRPEPHHNRQPSNQISARLGTPRLLGTRTNTRHRTLFPASARQPARQTTHHAHDRQSTRLATRHSDRKPITSPRRKLSTRGTNSTARLHMKTPDTINNTSTTNNNVTTAVNATKATYAGTDSAFFV